jgi:hypothetical protein
MDEAEEAAKIIKILSINNIIPSFNMEVFFISFNGKMSLQFSFLFNADLSILFNL